MKKIAVSFLKYLAASSLLFISHFASAQSVFTPESGWWYDPSINGRGYSIEIQDNVAFIAMYTYDTQTNGSGNRRPIWFATAGTLVGHKIFAGTFEIYENGTCVGCSFTPPNIPPTEKHAVTIEFLTSTTGTMTIGGQSFPIRRFIFAPAYNKDPVEKLLGEWSITMDSPSGISFPGIVSGELLLFETLELEDGTLFAVGCRTNTIIPAGCSDDDLDKRYAYAYYEEDFDRYILVAEDGSLYERLYLAYLGTEKMTGLVDRYRHDTGNFDFDRSTAFRGYRSASGSYAKTGSGPAKPHVETMSDLEKSVKYQQRLSERLAKRKGMPDIPANDALGVR